MSRRSLLFVNVVILTLFFLSGATGLIYEVIWTRFLTIAYGNTTLGVSAVLTAFMGGLGLGSYVFGRLIDSKARYLLIYAVLELGIGVTAATMPVIFDWLQTFYSIIFLKLPDSLWILQTTRTIMSFAALVIPTFMMGATLPVLSQFYIAHRKDLGKKVSLLYAINTLGATFGVFLAGFFMIKELGLTDAVYLTAVVNLVISLAFFLLHFLTRDYQTERQQQADTYAENSSTQQTADADHPIYTSRFVLFAFGIAGFTSLAYEVLWFRLLVFELQTTIYAFTVMLATFLVGIALGSAICGPFLRKATTRICWDYFGYIQGAIAACGAISIVMFGALQAVEYSVSVKSFEFLIFMYFVLAGLIMLPATLLMGAAFPVVCRIVSGSGAGVGGSIGRAYAANTLGAILGSFITGFFLVRYMGTQQTLVLVVSINLLLAAAVLAPSFLTKTDHGEIKSPYAARPAPLLITILALTIGALTWLPDDYLLQFYNVTEKRVDARVKILHAEEGLETITTVHRYPDGRRVISTGSINVAGTSYTLRTTQILQGHIPMLLHPTATEVAQVGFGSGETASIITSYGNVERLDLIDISQSVLDTSSKYFRDINHDVVTHEKFNPTIMDGANYMRLTNKKYDVIMNDSIWPFYAGNSGLYTYEYFQAGKQHLKPGGFMTSWLPIEIPPEDFEILLNSFYAVFPHVSIWVAVNHYNKHALIVGSEEKLKLDVATFLKRFDKYARKDLALIHLDDPINFLDSYQMDETVLKYFLAGKVLHTEDKPILEFSPSRGSATNAHYRVYEQLRVNQTNIAPILVNIPGDEPAQREFIRKIRAAKSATYYAMSGFIKHYLRQNGSQDDFNRALKIWPSHPGAATKGVLPPPPAILKLSAADDL